ncbi:hypothetical protein E3T29_10670 [Cryobacterium sp. TMT1-66-1]|nr:hypothetical protein E3T29_10670 [Cryobacterium sp. TMT1-66-1]
MTLVPNFWWLPAILAAVLLVDALMSFRPPKFIKDCLNGVNFPQDWWWTLIVIKLLATAGLVVGIFVPGVALAANAGVIAYFLAASVAHVRARFLKQEFWVNCLGILALAVVVFLFSFVV